MSDPQPAALRVLVVEDEPLIGMLIEMTFENGQCTSDSFRFVRHNDGSAAGRPAHSAMPCSTACLSSTSA